MNISCMIYTGAGYEPGYEHCVVRGVITGANAAEFRTMLLETITNSAHHLVLDIIGVDFADASGRGVRR